MIDHIRKMKRISLKDEFKPEVRTYTQPVANLKKNLQDALNTLNETQKSLVLLKDYEGYKVSCEEDRANNRTE